MTSAVNYSMGSDSVWGYVDVVFDGPPGHESGRFVEVEDASGVSVKVGEWIDRGDGMWALRIPGARQGRMTTELLPEADQGRRTDLKKD
jgi:hypothetical protein